MNKTSKRKLRKNKTSKKGKKGNRKSKRFFHRKNIKKDKIVIVGGNINPPSFQPFSELEGKYYYYNNHAGDPTNVDVTLSSRNLPDIPKLTNISGGRRKVRKMKGGTFLSTSSLVNNPYTNFGSINGAIMGSNIMTGTPNTPNPDPIVHPSFYTYSEYRPPLA